MNTTEEKEETKDDFAKGIAYFWRSTNLEPRIRSVALREGISKVALGNHHTLLLTFNSQLLSVGDNSFGQLGLGDFKQRREPTVVDYFLDKRVLVIACGGHHSGVICGNNEVYFWGDSASGQCGVGEIKLVNQPSLVQFEHSITLHTKQESSTLEKDKTKKKPLIKEISCGDSHSLALSIAGEVWSWGTGCQLGHGVETEQVNVPKKIDFLTGRNVTSIVCGAYHSLAMVQGNRPCPTFMVCEESRFDQKAKPVKAKKKQRKLSKGSLKKNQTTTKHHSGTTSPQKAKVDKHDTTGNSNVAKSTVTRTYLSYEPVSSGENTRSTCETVEGKQSTPEHDEREDKSLPKEIQNFDSLDYVDCSALVSESAPGESTHGDESSLTICDTHFADQEEAIIDKYFDINIEQVKSAKQEHSDESSESQSNENILYSSTSPLFPSSPSNSGSLSYFTSTDSDSEESLTKTGLERKTDEVGLAGRISSGFYSGFGSRLIRSDVNLSKLTSAVMGSVAGMFITSVPGSLALRDPAGVLMAKKPCKQCGLVGLCLCDSGTSKFRVAGSNTQIWSWGRGGCGQLGLGDTEDRYEMSLPLDSKVVF